MQALHLLKLAAAAVGQTLLLAFAWGFLGAVLLRRSLPLPYLLAHIMVDYPSETTMVVTLLGTVLSVATTFCFSIALKEALGHRMHKPITLITLTGGITITRGDVFVSSRHLFTTMVMIAMFGLTKLMISSWATLLTPTYVAHNYDARGQELNLNSTYFDSALGSQFLSTGSATPAQGNSIKIIDIDGLLSGIATAQFSFGVCGILDFNGVSYNTSTGGVIPAVPGYNGSTLPVQPGNTGLNFVGGSIPTNLGPIKPQDQTISSNFTVWQQGLTADVTCSQLQTVPITAVNSTLQISVFTGNSTWISAWAYSMTCPEGNAAQQDYVILANNNAGAIPAIGIVASLVCPYPVDQSQLDWTQFNVTTWGSGRYSFLQPTTYQITPNLTTSLVTYTSQVLKVQTIVNSTVLNSTRNANLSLFLASMIDYQAKNAQGLTSNSIGDALYSIAVSNGTRTSDSGPMDPNLLTEMDYWRGVIEFSGTYLRSGFSVDPENITGDGWTYINVTQTITTKGWNKRSKIYLYTVIPVSFFALLTYIAIGYALWQTFVEQSKGRNFTIFDPTNPIHLIMVSSTRGNEPGNLKGETLGGFSKRGIQDNEDRRVQLDNVCIDDGRVRRRFKLLSSTKPDHIEPVPQPMDTNADAESRTDDLDKAKVGF